MAQRITQNSPALPATSNRLLTNKDFARQADVPPEIEWFANFGNSQTRRAYENALQDFMAFTNIQRPEKFREVTRAHIIVWRDYLEEKG